MRVLLRIMITCVVATAALTASVSAQDIPPVNDQPALGGIGIGFGVDSLSNRFMVTHVGVGLPAHAAGVYPGDVLVSADMIPFAGMDMDAIAAQLRGEAGTSVAVGIERDARTQEFEIERAIYSADSVRFLGFGCFSGDCDNGNGIGIYPYRDRYEGGFVNGFPHGEGTYFTPSGTVFTGRFVDGLPVTGTRRTFGGEVYVGEVRGFDAHGEGTITLPDGLVFAGEWSNDLAVNGTMTYPSGASYTGPFDEQTRRHGPGVLTLASGGIVEGVWVDGRIPSGSYLHDNGERYEGEMSDTYQMHGRGTYTWVDGHALAGEWSSDRPLTGTMIFPSGDSYTGAFDEENGRHGRGTYTWTTGGTIAGEWSDDRVLTGTRTYPSGYSYTGAFDEQYRRHGRGVLTLPRGDTIEGQWVEGLITNGTIAYVTGDRYEGEMNESYEREGRGTFTYQSGRTDTGDWEADTLTNGTVAYAEGGSYTGTMIDGQPPETAAPPPAYTPPPPAYTPPPPAYTPPPVYTPPPPAQRAPMGVDACIDGLVRQRVAEGWTYVQRLYGSAWSGRYWNLRIQRTSGLEFSMFAVSNSEIGGIGLEINGWVGDQQISGASFFAPAFHEFGCSVTATHDSARGSFDNGGPNVSVRVPGASMTTNVTLLLFER